MNVLLIGNGGREHALAWRLSKSQSVANIFVAPGNGGTCNNIPKTRNVDIQSSDFEGLVKFARESSINLVIPGPEAPLVDGVTDYFQCRIPNIKVFGPSQTSARLEGSKTFSKDFMTKYDIPTARYRNFSSYDAALKHIDDVTYDIVIKATGLAAGKGVIIPTNKTEAKEALEQIMVTKDFGAAGDEVVIEEYLHGDELSFLTFSDGYTIKSLPAAQDHKKAYDGDKGPNTGGMGAYAPAPIATPDLVERVHKSILQPTVDAMRKGEKSPFIGILFTGLMITTEGPRVLEYNVRFGDPETQTLLPLISDETDLAELMLACVDHRLDSVELGIKPGSAVTIVAAAKGYPNAYNKGDVITIAPALENESTHSHIFHAGTAMKDGKLTTAGGRVIATTSTAASLQEALTQAYGIMSSIEWPGKQHRSDIAHRALKSGIEPLVQEQKGTTYASAGVSISAGNDFVQAIKAMVRSTARPGALSELGGFGGTFDLQEAGYLEVPRLVTGTDGVGTKLKIAQTIGQHDTIGIDLVAMNVNDLVVQGAEPLFFTDVYSCGKLDVEIAAKVVKGICEGCIQANCALVGGETAEMAGFFTPGEYDVVGATTGAIPFGQAELPQLSKMMEGDQLIGLASSGCHSNGYSLIRKVVEATGLQYTDPAPWADETSVGQSLLVPTKIYVKPLLAAVKKGLIKGMAHITGGGLLENVPRMLPKHLAAVLDAATWQCPAVMNWLKKSGAIQDEEFARVFNTGIGMVLVVEPALVDQVTDLLKSHGEIVYGIGHLARREDTACVIHNMSVWN